MFKSDKMATLPAVFGLFMIAVVTGQLVNISPEQQVVRVGEDFTVTCKVTFKPEACRMVVGKASYILRPHDQEGDVVYYGKGLDQGECGALFKRAREEWNGNVSCMVPPERGNEELVATMRLIVARAPSQPILRAPAQAFVEGQRLDAQCIVPDARPAANISWFLDDEPITKGLRKPEVTDDPTTGLSTVIQNLTIDLRAEDNARRLVCSAEHAALPQPITVNRQLIVQYPPSRVEGEGTTMTVFGLKLGSEGRLNVTIRASPAPYVEWTVGDVTLIPPAATNDGALTALPPVALVGPGYYNVTLILARVSKEDVDRKYYLHAKNLIGESNYEVRLSTMDEPVGVELDTGAIVGIVVAVLVLLAAVLLGVFAKVTDRWCFAGRSHRTDIPDGGDSEAPLPPHEDVKGSENPSHDHEYITNGKHPEKKPDTAV